MKHSNLFLVAVASISSLLFSCSKDKENIEKPEQKTFLLEKSVQTSGTNTYTNNYTITIVEYYNADKTAIALSRAYNAADVLQSETRFTYDDKKAIPGPFSSTQPFVSKRNVLSAETKDTTGKIISTSEYENVYAANGTKSKVTYTYKAYTNYPTFESTSVYI